MGEVYIILESKVVSMEVWGLWKGPSRVLPQRSKRLGDSDEEHQNLAISQSLLSHFLSDQVDVGTSMLDHSK